MDKFGTVFTASAQTFVFDTVSVTGAYVQFQGTYAGAVVVFEGTVDGATTWIPLSSFQLNIAGGSPTAMSQTLTTNGTQQYYVFIGGSGQVRVRTTGFTSGTLSVDIQVVRDADPVQPAAAATGTTAVSNFPTAAAVADGAANPTTTSVATNDQWFNGTTWDRVRSNSPLTLDGSSARTASGNGTASINYNWRGAIFYLNVTAASGTTPTLTWRIQWSYDGGTTWIDYDTTNLQTASITTTGASKLIVYPGITTTANAQLGLPLPRNFRTAWTIGGTTPSFTFASYAQFIL
jgi:hypothetical protein